MRGRDTRDGSSKNKGRDALPDGLLRFFLTIWRRQIVRFIRWSAKSLIRFLLILLYSDRRFCGADVRFAARLAYSSVEGINIVLQPRASTDSTQGRLLPRAISGPDRSRLLGSVVRATQGMRSTPAMTEDRRMMVCP